MAAVFSDTVTGTSHYSRMGHEDSPPSPASGTSSSYRRSSRSQPRMPPSPRPQPTEIVPPQPAANTLIASTSSQKTDSHQSFASEQNFPTPTSSQTQQSAISHQHSQSQKSAPLISPASSNSPITRSAWSADDIENYGGSTIKVRDLAHIQSFATNEFLARRGSQGRRRGSSEAPVKYEISGMPIADVIEMVAGLLTKITTTNDLQHKTMHDSIPSADSAASLPGHSSSVLAFHGKNVPSITILSYLARIHKYCPTTYEVFLSLLVYFDRMTERVNAGPVNDMKKEPERKYSKHEEDVEMKIPSSSTSKPDPNYATPPDEDHLQYNLSTFFVVDSFNIHRLVIAGVTCASKFFSDVFYTNSRYAKVGGLPLPELNHLELQFLLLNDFRLSVPVEELESYGTMLVEFYAREVIAQKKAEQDSYDDDNLMEAADSD